MPNKAGSVAEAVPALGAPKWLFSRVDSLMCAKVGSFHEAFRAAGTLVRFLCGVLALVFDKALFVAEASPKA